MRPRAGAARTLADRRAGLRERATSSRTTASSRSPQGDLLAIGAAGAYGMAMSSNYNARPRACEVIVDGDAAHLVRRRERVDELFAGESTLP